MFIHSCKVKINYIILNKGLLVGDEDKKKVFTLIITFNKNDIYN